MSTDLEEKFIIIGRGNQAKAWAHSFKLAKRDYALAVRELGGTEHPEILIGPELKPFKNFALLIPDESHQSFLESQEKNLMPGSRILYAHGYSVTYQKLNEKFPQFDHLLYAPKSIANEIIKNRNKDIPTPVFCSIEFSNPEQKSYLESLSRDLRFFIASYGSFKEEVIADLFSEQTLLCGLYPFMISEAFEILKENGINKDLSFLECWHESKLIMDTLIEKGPQDFFKMISPNALYGALEASKILFDDSFKSKLRKIYSNIQSGEFEKKVHDEYKKENALDEINGLWQSSELQEKYNQFQGQLYQ